MEMTFIEKYRRYGICNTFQRHATLCNTFETFLKRAACGQMPQFIFCRSVLNQVLPVCLTTFMR